MTVFILASVALAVIALAFIVVPLLRRRAAAGLSRDAINVAVYRDQLRELDADLQAGTLLRDQYERSRAEIEARLLQDTKQAGGAVRQQRSEFSAVVFAIALPICALGVYLAVGNPQAIGRKAAATDSAHGVTQEQVLEMVAKLDARMRANPDDPAGWTMLARSYAVLGRFKEASEAYANAVARAPNDAQLLADYADTLAMAQEQKLEGEPERLIERALAIDPKNVKALALAGTVAFNRKDYTKAIEYWERILPVVPPDSETAQAVRASISEARAFATGAPAPASTASGSAPSSAGARVSGTVKLAPALAAKVEPGDTVFIFARAVDGPRMPLAILRRQARDLPITFTLDDSMAMTPQMKLSSFPKVVVGARVSKQANATPQPGDLQGYTAPVDVGSNSIDLVIDTELR